MSRFGDDAAIDHMELCNISPDPRDYDSNCTEIQLRELKDAYEDCGFLFFKVTKEHAALKAQLANEERTTDRLRAAQNKDRKEIESLRKELESVKNGFNAMKREKDALKDEKEKAESDFLSLRRERNDNEKKRSDFERERKTIEEKYKCCKNVLENERKKHQDEMAGQTRINKVLSADLEKERAERAEEVECLRKKNNELENNLQQKNEEFNQNKKQHDQKLDFFNIQAQKLNDEIKRLTEELENERSVVKKQSLKIDNLKDVILKTKSLMQKNLPLFRKDLEKLKSEVPNFKCCFSNFNEQYSTKLTELLNECRQKRDDNQNSYEKFMATNITVYEKAQEAIELSLKFEKRNQFLESEIAVQKKIVSEHEEKISSLKEQLEAAKNAEKRLTLKTSSPSPKISIPVPDSNSVDDKKQSLKRLMPSPTVSYADDVFMSPDGDKKKPKTKTELEFLRREMEYHRQETVKHQTETHQLQTKLVERENELVLLQIELDKAKKQKEELSKEKNNLLDGLSKFLQLGKGKQQTQTDT